MRQTRMARAVLIIATCVLVVLVSRFLMASSSDSGDEHRVPNHPPSAVLRPGDVLMQVSKSNNRFGFSLVNHLLYPKKQKQGLSSTGSEGEMGQMGDEERVVDDAREELPNVIASPFSVSVALGMMLLGARGSTAEELREALQLPYITRNSYPYESSVLLGKLAASFNKPNKDEAPAPVGRHHHEGDPLILNVANSLWGSASSQFSSFFLRKLKEDFASELHTVDFNQAQAASDKINHWVEDKTKGKILDIVNPASVNGAQLILVNAIYFKGSWANPFLKENTKPDIFHLDKGEKKVDYMHRVGSYNYYSNGQLQAIELSYFENEAAMMLILPSTSSNNIEWSEELFSELRAGAQRKKVDLSVPKFEFTSSFDLSKELRGIGITKPFQSDADFSGISMHSTPVDQIVHKAFIAVDEKGTEAAAATTITFRSTAFIGHEENVIELKLDRPFLFSIYQKETGIVLFAGRVSSPSSSKL